VISLVTAAVLVVGIAAIRRLMHLEPFPFIASVVLNIIVGMQLLVIVLGGANAVHRALLRDYQTKMNESHRLTPMPGFAVCLGYLFGATLQVTALFVVFTIVGVGVNLVARSSPGHWLLGNLILLNGGITVWAAAIFGSIRLEKPFSPAPIIVGIAALTVPICYLPGAGLVLSVYSALIGVWIAIGGLALPTPAVLMVAVVNVVFTVFWLLAAARKYRRPDLPALNACHGLILLVLALVVSLTGLAAVQRSGWAGPTSIAGPGFAQGQWVATMIGALVIACVAVGGTVKCRVLVRNGTAPRDWSDRVPGLVTALVATALICVLMASLGAPIWRVLAGPSPSGDGVLMSLTAAWSSTVAACLLALVTIRSVFELAYLRFKSGNLMVGLFVIVAWGLAPIADVIRAEYFRVGNEAAVYSWLLGCSPFGTISIIWCGAPVVIGPGLLVQTALLVLLAYVAWRTRRKPPSKNSTEGDGRTGLW
jgi:hypothetical protein